MGSKLLAACAPVVMLCAVHALLQVQLPEVSNFKLGMLLAGRAVKGCPASMVASVVLQANADVRLASLPSKRLGLFAAQPSLIARSDSNGEDLEAFAGAGEPKLCLTASL